MIVSNHTHFSTGVLFCTSLWGTLLYFPLVTSSVAIVHENEMLLINHLKQVAWHENMFITRNYSRIAKLYTRVTFVSTKFHSNDSIDRGATIAPFVNIRWRTRTESSIKIPLIDLLDTITLHAARSSIHSRNLKE